MKCVTHWYDSCTDSLRTHDHELMADNAVSIAGIQEAQLSQRGRATLRVIEYFAESLKITRCHWNSTFHIYDYELLLAFHSDNGSTRVSFWR